MKIQCDVCDKNLAAVMCCADEAALCSECDARIHGANKLATKHVRVALHAPLEPPKCDICQEKQGFFFCLEDRALLCRDCDVSIHTANTLCCNHQRFLIPGTRVALEELKDSETIQTVNPPPEPVAAALSSLPSVASSTVSSQSSLSSMYSSISTLPISNNPAATVYRDPAPCCPPYSYGTNLQQNAPDMKMSPEFRTTAQQLILVPGEFAEIRAGKALRDDTLRTGRATVTNVAPPTMKKSSISEFLTASVPGWRVDELLNFPDPATEGAFTSPDFNTKAVDAAAGGDYDWTAELKFFEEHMFSMHEVPQFPPPNSTAPISAPRNSKNSGKLQDMSLNAHGSPNYDDAFIVPNIRVTPSGPPLSKRLKRDLYHV